MDRIIPKLITVLTLTQACLVGCTHNQAHDTKAITSQELTPRKVFFENPTRALPQISPDGKWLAYLAEKDGVMNVWVAPVADLTQAKVVTADKARGIRMFTWDLRSRFVLYSQDEGGNENFHLFASDVNTGKTRDLTPYPGVQAQINRLSPLHPDEILVGLNDRDPKHHDLYRIKLESGERSLLMRNDEGFAGYITDLNYKVQIAQKSLPDGGKQILALNPKGKWTSILQVPLEDALTTDALDLDKSGKVLYTFSSVGRDTSALYSFDLGSKKFQVMAENPKADARRVMIHPTTQMIQAVGFEYERNEWTILDSSIASDWETLSKVNPGELSIVSRTLDDQTWIVAFSVSDGPTRFYRYNRQSKAADFLFTNRPQLEGLKLAEMRPMTLTARDGLKLVSYLTVPPAKDKDSNGRPDQALPLVLLVHGGPWARDSWGFNPTHQWLASRGYAVLSVNYRGSTGFGKKFINAGNFEWAGRMHDDLLDAVDWAVREKIADPTKVAIYGGSYGGYATLVGLTFTPDRFACGVDIVGPSNLETLLNSLPPYWQPVIEQFTKRVGDHRTEAGRKLLRDRSPLHRAGAITKPLLIGQGANDPRVKQAEADQIVKAMQDKKIPVTYVLYPDEGHGFARPQNRLSFSAVAESFLGSCLGGAVQSFGDDIAGSSLKVPTGAEYVPGLKQALDTLK